MGVCVGQADASFPLWESLGKDAVCGGTGAVSGLRSEKPLCLDTRSFHHQVKRFASSSTMGTGAHQVDLSCTRTAMVSLHILHAC